jgi:hypothetical protein
MVAIAASIVVSIVGEAAHDGAVSSAPLSYDGATNR